jgi:nucleotide-binding universal stress UspA family protein
MKNILLVIDGDHLNKENILFACYLAALTESRLTGIFLENNVLDPVPALKMAYGMPYTETMVASDAPGYHQRKLDQQQNMDTFKAICGKQGILSSVHPDTGFPLTQLMTESRYADLIIIGNDLAFQASDQSRPTHFVKDFLRNAECPVVVAPRHFNGIDEIVFAYDESASAAFAIKQFSYLLPELENRKLTIVQVMEGETGEPIQIGRLSQMISCHYSNVHFHKLYGQASTELFSYLFNKQKTIVIMGSYGRNSLSEVFSHSTAEPLIKNLDLPFFIAHS